MRTPTSRRRRWTGSLMVVAVLAMGASVSAVTAVAVERGEQRYAGQVNDTADDILREADLAMYAAKTTGKSRYVEAGALSG